MDLEQAQKFIDAQDYGERLKVEAILVVPDRGVFRLVDAWEPSQICISLEFTALDDFYWKLGEVIGPWGGGPHLFVVKGCYELSLTSGLPRLIQARVEDDGAVLQWEDDSMTKF